MLSNFYDIIIEMSEDLYDELLSQGISKKTIKAMKINPRHKFVPKELWHLAYENRPLSIGYGQTISQPYIVGLMIDKLNLDKSDKVLEIGTGSGWSTAILACMTNKIYSIELVKELYEKALNRITKSKFKNIYLINGNGWNGYSKEAPYDKIIVNAEADKIPEKLIDQLKINGIMIIPLLNELLLIKKINNNKLDKTIITYVAFVPFVH
jgi:protein-L-isoaspartate(D-aspartate) O-methyltransferase